MSDRELSEFVYSPDATEGVRSPFALPRVAAAVLSREIKQGTKSTIFDWYTCLSATILQHATAEKLETNAVSPPCRELEKDQQTRKKKEQTETQD